MRPQMSLIGIAAVALLVGTGAVGGSPAPTQKEDFLTQLTGAELRLDLAVRDITMDGITEKAREENVREAHVQSRQIAALLKSAAANPDNFHALMSSTIMGTALKQRTAKASDQASEPVSAESFRLALLEAEQNEQIISLLQDLKARH